MRYRKVYGESKVESCPWCGSSARLMTEQGVPCCVKHKDKVLPDMKCACGSWLDLKSSKFGPFWVCLKCGPISWKKAMEMNPISGKTDSSVFKVQSSSKTEKIISWEDL